MSYHLLPDKYRFESGLLIFVLESALALALLVFIVWWTLPLKRRTDAETHRKKREEG